MYNTKTITIGEDTITNNTETYEILFNEKLYHKYAIRRIDDKCNLITQAGNTFRTIPPYETKLTIEQINAIRVAYTEEEDDAPAKKTTKKTSKATIKGKKQNKKTEADVDDKQE